MGCLFLCTPRWLYTWKQKIVCHSYWYPRCVPECVEHNNCLKNNRSTITFLKLEHASLFCTKVTSRISPQTQWLVNQFPTKAVVIHADSFLFRSLLYFKDQGKAKSRRTQGPLPLISGFWLSPILGNRAHFLPGHVSQVRVHGFVVVVVVCLLGPHPRHMQLPRLGVESELPLPAYITATAMPDPSWVCDLCLSNAGSLTHWARPGIEPRSSWVLVGFVSAVLQWEEFTVLALVLSCFLRKGHVHSFLQPPPAFVGPPSLSPSWNSLWRFRHPSPTINLLPPPGYRLPRRLDFLLSLFLFLGHPWGWSCPFHWAGNPGELLSSFLSSLLPNNWLLLTTALNSYLAGIWSCVRIWVLSTLFSSRGNLWNLFSVFSAPIFFLIYKMGAQ